MSADTFEYAIKKDVRNNPIVREVDEERHREMWRSVTLGVFLVGVLLFSAWQHFELLRHGYRLEQMQRDRAAEGDINRHLRLEMETLRARGFAAASASPAITGCLVSTFNTTPPADAGRAAARSSSDGGRDNARNVCFTTRSSSE